MGQWREVAGSSHGTLRGNHRVNSGVEHFAKSVDYVRANAAEAFGESVGAEEHHGAGFAFVERFANAAGMGAHEIYLQLCNLLRGDAHGSEFAEAGVDAVGGRAGGYEFVHHRARGFHALDGGRVKGDGFMLQRHGAQLFEGKIVASENYAHGITVVACVHDTHDLLMPAGAARAAEKAVRYFSGRSLGLPLLPQMT